MARMSVRREDIEEVVNDTFWVVWTKAGEFRGASQLSTWIIGIAYRRALNALRRAKIRPVSDSPFDEDSISVDSTDAAETDGQWLALVDEFEKESSKAAAESINFPAPLK